MKKLFSVFIILVMCITSVSALGLTADAANQTGTVNCDALNVRSGAGTSYSKVAVIYSGQTVTVTGSATDSSGNKWYKISFTYSGASKTGYAFAEYITITSSGSSGSSDSSSSSGTTDADFEKYMTAQGFPDSYKPMLRALHQKYPNWIFKAQHLNIDWYTALEEELVLGRNLVHSGALASWKSMEKGAYNFNGGYWYGLDGSWVAASKEIIAYYLDPRNFINDPSIFMFENLSYNSSVHTISGVKNILSGTFMSGNYTTPDTNKTYSYAQTFMDAAEKSGVSPYHLASRCRNEQGVNGAPQSLGTVPGYENYFNFFDVNAYATSTMTAAQMGCKYAMTTNPTYLLPWTNQYKSIVGGSIFVGTGYINKGQDTLYLQKFDVVDGGNGYYYHQYMTCVFGQENEAVSIKKAYSQDMLNSAMEFKIPVYKNMPDEVYKKPTSSGDNNNFLKSLSVSGYKLNETFDKYTMSYSLSTEVTDSSVTITAPALSSGATVSGAGKVALQVGTNTVKINVTAPSGVVRTYTITITRKAGSSAPENVTNFKGTSTASTIKLTWSKVSGAEGYVIYQYNTSTKKYARIEKTESNIATYTVENLNSGTEYKFAIRAYKTVNSKEVLSESFPECVATTKPATVKSFKATSKSNSITLTWEKAEGAEGYVIYQYNTSTKKYARIEKTESNIATYTVENLKSGTEYKFAIRAYKTVDGKEVLSESFPELEVATKLSTVTTFKGTSTASTIKLTWSKVSGAEGYVIYQYNTSTKKYARIEKTESNIATYTVDNLKSGTEYKFAIRAYKTVNSKEVLSESFPECVATTKPATVKSFKATSKSNSITLTWEKAEGAEGYVIYQYNTSTKKYARIEKTESNIATYTVDNLKAGTEYKFAIRAYKTVNSKEVLSESFPELEVATKLPTVTTFKGTSTASTIKLTWSKVSGAEGYVIYQYNTSTKKYARIEKTESNIATYTVDNLKSGTEYKFAIRAYKTVNSKEVLSESFPELKIKTKN